MITLVRGQERDVLIPGKSVKINRFARKDAQESNFNPHNAVPIAVKVFESTAQGALVFEIPSKRYPRKIEPKRIKTIKLDPDTKLVIQPARNLPPLLPPYDSAV